MARDPLCPVYQRLFRTALAVWQDGAVVEENFQAMVQAL